MKINITNRDYRVLLDLIALADMVLESAPEGIDTDEYDAFIQKMLSHAKSFMCNELVGYHRREDRYYLSEDLTESMDLLAIMKTHTTEVFWIELPRQLAIRDMMEKCGTTEPEELSPELAAAAFLTHVEKYESEFMENDLDNLRIEGLTVSDEEIEEFRMALVEMLESEADEWEDEESETDRPIPEALNAPDPRFTEKTLASIHRLVESREFASTEEMSEFINQALASGEDLVDPSTLSELDKAQELIYEAWQTTEGKERVRLAEKALRVSPDCADAYIILAEETARTIEEAQELYEKAVAAGEQGLGEGFLEQHEGHFWGMVETRPYMRARAGLAMTLWAMNSRQEAIRELENLVKLNPNDNQGNRYQLLIWYLAEGQNTKAKALLEKYEEPSASWLYSGAFLTYRQSGDTAKSRAVLKQALLANPHVPLYLLGRKRLPKESPGLIGIGDTSEAIAYVLAANFLWQKESGALEWLAANS